MWFRKGLIISAAALLSVALWMATHVSETQNILGRWSSGYAMALFAHGQKVCAERGLILVDTKYEFGKTASGQIVLIDEIHTPDSSRYFYADGYRDRQERGEPQKQLSKEFVRRWLIENGFQGKEGQKIPHMSDEKISEISDRYIELYENITGKTFEKADTSNIAQRIERNVVGFLKTL